MIYCKLDKRLHELKGLELDNANKEQNLKASQFEYALNNEFSREQRIYNLRQQSAQFKNIEADSDNKFQQLENMKGALRKLLVETQLSEIERNHRDANLNVNRQLAESRIRQTGASVDKMLSEIRRMDVSTSQDVKMFQYRIDEMIERIQSMKLGNEHQSYENYFAPDFLSAKTRKEGFEADMAKNQSEFLNTLDPSVRYIVERMGGKEAIQALLQYISKGKLMDKGHGQAMERIDF